MDFQLMRRFAAWMPVVYVNSVVMRRLNVGEGRMFMTRFARKARSIGRGLTCVAPRFHVYSPATLPVHYVPGLRRVNRHLLLEQVRLILRRLQLHRPLVWVVCPAACDVALALPRAALVYQRSDRFEEYPGVDADQVIEWDGKLKRLADVTFYANRKLIGEEESQCRRAVFLDHGVDFERFASTTDRPDVPPDVEHLSHPVIGYFGDIDAKIVNVPLLLEIGRRMPDCQFVFVGTSTVDTRALAERVNVTMIPRQPYERIADYGKCFDVAIMPFHRNSWIEVCNPIKLKEYLALGKPVVSTPFSELTHYDGQVYRALTAAEWEAAIRLALEEDSVERAAARQARVRPYSWESRAQMALESLGLR